MHQILASVVVFFSRRYDSITDMIIIIMIITVWKNAKQKETNDDSGVGKNTTKHFAHTNNLERAAVKNANLVPLIPAFFSDN